jgi:hypothetical protein
MLHCKKLFPILIFEKVETGELVLEKTPPPEITDQVPCPTKGLFALIVKIGGAVKVGGAGLH